MFVKICGITSEEDALLAVAMGADAIGFVFAPSSRQVAAGHVRDIVRRLPPEVLTVGVFRDESPQRVVEIVNTVGLRAAQLHGHETVEHTRLVRSKVPFVIKGFPAGDPALERAVTRALARGKSQHWSAVPGCLLPDHQPRRELPEQRELHRGRPAGRQRRRVR